MTLTAIEEFSKLHDTGGLPANERYYRDLLPTEQPGAGQQYAFAVDLDACTGCKACVVACHSLNGLDEDESWRSVGLIQGGRGAAFQQTVTTACHHCVDPACLSGCPVDAYEKDDKTGIVVHLDDQCIGCSYCTLTCPYEVPKFSKSRGIVRKCDMCRGRLAEGEAPACVQACPNGAISITIVTKDEVRRAATASAAEPAVLVPGAPPSALTVPTTSYRTARTVPADARAADHFSLRPAQSHPPLAVMLVLTQMAVGVLAFDVALRALSIGSLTVAPRPVGAVVAAATGVLALLASTLHLGRPLYAFRAVLGFRHSWLSREIVAFATFAAGAPAYAVALAAGVLPSPAELVLGSFATAAGVAGIASSVMLYAVTGRRWWRARSSAVTFALSAALTGAAATTTTTALALALRPAIASAAVPAIRAMSVTVLLVTIAKLAREIATLRHLRGAELTEMRRSAMLLRGDLWTAFQARLLLGAAGGILVPAAMLRVASAETSALTLAATTVATALLLAGELIERNHFFQVAVAPRMPGELA